MRIKFLAIGTLVLCAIFAFPAWSAWRTWHRAEAFLADLRLLRVGHSTFQQATELAARYDIPPSARTPRCSSLQCDWDLVIENDALHRWLLFPSRRLGATVKVANDRVSMISAAMDDGGRLLLSASTLERLDPPEQPKPVAVSAYRDRENRVYRITITLTQEASDSERAKAYSFNTACLIKPFGCSDARELVTEYGNIASQAQ
jgi:hypothetical protein